MLSEEQKKALEGLWDIYGNHGPKFTIGNHKFIQHMLFVDDAELDSSIDRYNQMMDNDPDKAITEECMTDVRNVLGA